MNVAIVHDWIYGGGAERVVEQLHQLYPDAPIYTSYCSPEWRKKLDNKVVTGYLQHWPFNKLRKFAGPLRIGWFGKLKFDNFDLVISSAGNGEAKDINVPKTTKYICYCHSPSHFYWRDYDGYIKNPGFGFLDPVARLGLRILAKPLRKRDYLAAQKPDLFIANSNFIKDEIKKYYGRDAEVINPPVNISRFKSVSNSKRSGYITLGRQVPYKYTDLIIRACNNLQIPLKVVGGGPEHNNLKQIAGPTIKFFTEDKASDKAVPELLSTSEAFIFAAYEDFGIAPVEALASGIPVIAYGKGGALDYVNSNTGVTFNEQSVESIENAIKSFRRKQFDSKKIVEFAEKFSNESFRQKIFQAIDNQLKSFEK